MINVFFFAKLREDVGVGHIELPVDGLLTIVDIVKALGIAKGERMATALAAKNIIVAINHEVADFTATVQDGDEVAFYPPVSGG